MANDVFTISVSVIIVKAVDVMYHSKVIATEYRSNQPCVLQAGYLVKGLLLLECLHVSTVTCTQNVCMNIREILQRVRNKLWVIFWGDLNPELQFFSVLITLHGGGYMLCYFWLIGFLCHVIYDK